MNTPQDKQNPPAPQAAPAISEVETAVLPREPARPRIKAVDRYGAIHDFPGFREMTVGEMVLATDFCDAGREGVLIPVVSAGLEVHPKDAGFYHRPIQPPTPVTPRLAPDGWRRLEVGELIQKGDRALTKEADPLKHFESCSIGTCSDGDRVTELDRNAYYRPIVPAPLPKAPEGPSPGMCDATPEGWVKINAEVFRKGDALTVLGTPDDEADADEPKHNCDAMGCRWNHVIAHAKMNDAQAAFCPECSLPVNQGEVAQVEDGRKIYKCERHGLIAALMPCEFCEDEADSRTKGEVEGFAPGKAEPVDESMDGRVKIEIVGLRAELTALRAANGEMLEAIRTFAGAWAEWHNHGGSMPDEELIDASHALLPAAGLEMVEDENDVHSIRALSTPSDEVGK